MISIMMLYKYYTAWYHIMCISIMIMYSIGISRCSHRVCRGLRPRPRLSTACDRQVIML